MIEFSPMSFTERMKRFFSPAYRRRRDAEMKEAIRELVKNPDAPCMIQGHLIVNGRGDIHYNPFADERTPW